MDMSRRLLKTEVSAGRKIRRGCPRTRPVCMAGSTYGHCFRVTTFGESHGKGVGCVIDGVPPLLPVSEEEVQKELDRRRPGQSRLTTPRKETDTCEILSGVSDGVALGTPIAVLVRNRDQKSKDYKEMSVSIFILGKHMTKWTFACSHFICRLLTDLRTLMPLMMLNMVFELLQEVAAHRLERPLGE